MPTDNLANETPADSPDEPVRGAGPKTSAAIALFVAPRTPALPVPADDDGSIEFWYFCGDGSANRPG